ncbi:MAG: glycosyltransferase family 2 protein [Alphaproteobacteria bacterium]|nr:glycosyltransferase family 2 protein [Alphaproteobacteria bacterium]
MPLLSICIPTYNRAKTLQKSLETLVTQQVFQDTCDVEIIISDNASTDNTKEIALSYTAQYGDKIKYFCNPQNLNDANFAVALKRASGEFLKLSNDTLLYQPQMLEKFVALIKKHSQTKPVIFFSNNPKHAPEQTTSSLDEFVKTASFQITWIGGFGIWKSDLDNYFTLLKEYSQTKLPQAATLLKMTADKKQAVISGGLFCSPAFPSLKGDYNLSAIFIKNYLAFYEEYLQTKQLSKKIYEHEKWLVLKKHVLPRQFNLKHHYQYDKSDFYLYTAPYHKNPKFYFLIAVTLLKKLKYTLKYFIKKTLDNRN